MSALDFRDKPEKIIRELARELVKRWKPGRTDEDLRVVIGALVEIGLGVGLSQSQIEDAIEQGLNWGEVEKFGRRLRK